jgi:hypothetical protein
VWARPSPFVTQDDNSAVSSARQPSALMTFCPESLSGTRFLAADGYTLCTWRLVCAARPFFAQSETAEVCQASVRPVRAGTVLGTGPLGHLLPAKERHSNTHYLRPLRSGSSRQP